MADTITRKCEVCEKEFDSIIEIDGGICDDCKEKERVSSQLIIDLRATTAILSIKEIAFVLGAVYEDLELEVLIKEIKNLAINI